MAKLLSSIFLLIFTASLAFGMGTTPPIITMPKGIVMNSSPEVVEEVKRIATRLYEEGEEAYAQYLKDWTISTLDVVNNDHVVVETPFNRAVNYCYMAMMETSQDSYKPSKQRMITNDEIAAFFDQPQSIVVQAIVYISSPGEASNFSAVLYKNKSPLKLRSQQKWRSSNSEYYPGIPKYKAVNFYEFDISDCQSTDVLELDIVKHPEGEVLDVNFDPPRDTFKIDLSKLW